MLGGIAPLPASAGGALLLVFGGTVELTGGTTAGLVAETGAMLREPATTLFADVAALEPAAARVLLAGALAPAVSQRPMGVPSA